MKHTVFIVEDHPITRQGFTSLLEAQPDLRVCGAAGTLAEALAAIPPAAPDLVVVDLTLADGSGLELIKQLGVGPGRRKVLVVSMHDELLYAERALQAGALGYVMKDVSSGVLLEAIRQVLRGQVYVSEAMRDRLMERSIWLGAEPPASVLATLSDREVEVFEQLGRGCTSRQIADRMGISLQTVSTYRERIKQKLGLRNATELIQRAVAWVERGVAD